MQPSTVTDGRADGSDSIRSSDRRNHPGDSTCHRVDRSHCYRTQGGYRVRRNRRLSGWSCNRNEYGSQRSEQAMTHDVPTWIQTAIDLVGTVITIVGFVWRFFHKLHLRLDKIESKVKNAETIARDALLVASEGLGMRPEGRRWYDREARRVREQSRRRGWEPD